MSEKQPRGTAKKLLFGKKWSYWPCRCSKRSCQQRQTLKKHPDIYVKWPLCGCGAKLYVDYYRASKKFEETDKGGEACRCDGYPCPHRTNNIWCRNSTREPTEEQYRERYSYA